MVSFNTLAALSVLAAGVQSQQAASSDGVPAACSTICQPLVDLASACAIDTNTRHSSQRTGFFGPRELRRSEAPDHGKRSKSLPDHGKRSSASPDHGKRHTRLPDHGKRAQRLPDHGKRADAEEKEEAEQAVEGPRPGFFGPRMARAVAVQARFESASAQCGACVGQNGGNLDEINSVLAECQL